MLTIIKPIETSQDIICAADRKAPKNAYLELLDQPDIIIPYTPKEEIANKYKTPTFKSAYTTPSFNGIIDHEISASKKVKTGAITKMFKFALEGNIVSLTKSFKPSAKGWSKPNRPTTFGPLRRCIEAITLRSAKVMYAIAINTGTIIIKILIIMNK